MLQTYLYIPDLLKRKIEDTARLQQKSKAEVMRQALEEGVNSLTQKQAGGAEVLLKLAELSRKYKIKGPRDASINHDYYLWGLPKRNPRIKQ